MRMFGRGLPAAGSVTDKAASSLTKLRKALFMLLPEHSPDHFDLHGAEQSRSRLAAVPSGNGGVVIRQCIAHQHLDSVLAGFNKLRNVQLPWRRNLHARKL